MALVDAAEAQAGDLMTQVNDLVGLVFLWVDGP